MSENLLNKNAVILLTATVNPDGMTFTALNDINIRRRQYLEAIDYYLNETSYKVVVCENSGENIFDKIPPPETERLEYLTFTRGNDYNKSVGKSYGEAKIIQYAILHSEFIARADYIIKITGRLKILNIEGIINKVSENRADNIVALELQNKDWANTMCFCAQKNWLLATIERNIDEMFSTKQHIEAVLYRALADGNVKIVQIHPVIDGICAGLNKPYPNPGILYRKARHNFCLVHIYKTRKKWDCMMLCVVKAVFYRTLRILQVAMAKLFGHKK